MAGLRGCNPASKAGLWKTACLPTSALESNLDNFFFIWYSSVSTFLCWASSGMWCCEVFILSVPALSALRPAASLVLFEIHRDLPPAWWGTCSARVSCSLLQQHNCIKVLFSCLHGVLNMVRMKHCSQSLQNALTWKEPTEVNGP